LTANLFRFSSNCSIQKRYSLLCSEKTLLPGSAWAISQSKSLPKPVETTTVRTASASKDPRYTIPQQDFGFRCQDFGFQTSGKGCRVSGFGCRLSGFGCKVSGFGCRVSRVGFRASSFGLWVSSVGSQCGDTSKQRRGHESDPLRAVPLSRHK
jgi:hypothetical protein